MEVEEALSPHSLRRRFLRSRTPGCEAAVSAKLNIREAFRMRSIRLESLSPFCEAETFKIKCFSFAEASAYGRTLFCFAELALQSRAHFCEAEGFRRKLNELRSFSELLSEAKLRPFSQPAFQYKLEQFVLKC